MDEMSIEGTTKWLRTEDGTHVFCYQLKLAAEDQTPRIQSIHNWLNFAIEQMPEGARVRVTVAASPPAEPLVVEQPEPVPCPDCNGTGKIASTVPGVPASVCVRYTSCERCWPKDESGQRKFLDDGTAGTIHAPQVEQPEPEGGV